MKTSVHVDKESLMALQDACDSCLATFEVISEDETDVRVEIEYDYDFNLFYIGKIMGVNVIIDAAIPKKI